MERELVSVKEASELMGYSRMHVFRLIKNGEIKAHKVGRAYLVEKKSIPNIFDTEISLKEKKEVDSAVNKVFREYGDALKKLGKE